MARPRLTCLIGGLLGSAMLLTACGGGGEGGGDAGASARPPQAKVTVTQADVATPFQLQAGTYKVGWNAPDCSGVDFTMTGAAQGFTYAKSSKLPSFNAIVTSVPEDTYTLVQSDATCATWTVQIDKL